MTIRAVGSQTEIVFIEETTQGTVPTSGTVYKLKCAAETLDAAKPTAFDGDISGDGMKTGTIDQLNTVSGGFSGEMEVSAYDKFFLSGLRRSDFTTDEYGIKVHSITGAGETATATVSIPTSYRNGSGIWTANSTTSISGLLDDGLIKTAGHTETSFNGVFRVVSASNLGIVVLGSIKGGHTFAATTETNADVIATQKYAKNGGKTRKSFTIEKRLSHIAADNCMVRISGEEVNGINVSVQPGGSMPVSFDLMGLNDSVDDDGIVGPKDWVCDGISAASQTSLAIKSGTTDPSANDVLFVAGDPTEYVIVSYSGGTAVVTPALTTATVDEAKIYFYRPGTSVGVDKKVFTNLGTVVIDGTEYCISAGSLAISPNLKPVQCVGNENAVDMTPGDRSVTGSITGYFSDSLQTVLAKVRAGTVFDVNFYGVDIDGNAVAFCAPQVKADKELVKRDQQNTLSINIPFKGEKETTLGTNLIIHTLEA